MSDKGIPVDEQWLLDRLDKNQALKATENGKTAILGSDKGTTPTPDAVLDNLIDKTAKDTTAAKSTPKQVNLHKQADKKGLADKNQDEARKAQKEKERIEALQQAEFRKQFGAAGDAVSSAKNAVAPIGERAGQLYDRVAAAPTVGGIGLLILVLAILLMVVVQVNAAGDTRIKQFFYMLMGRAKLQGRVDIQKQDQSNSQAEASGASQAGQAILGALSGGVLNSAIGNAVQGGLLGGIGTALTGDGGYVDLGDSYRMGGL